MRAFLKLRFPLKHTNWDRTQRLRRGQHWGLSLPKLSNRDCLWGEGGFRAQGSCQ